jgi:KTSC domain
MVGSVVVADAETVNVKYRGVVDLAPFSSDAIDRSSFIRRVCYDASNRYMIVQLNETYYHYCDIDSMTVDAFKTAESMGRYFNASRLKGISDCRTGTVPSYR